MFNPRIQRLERMIEGMPVSGEVPQPSVADEGKVISVDSSGEYVLEDLPSEVPEPSVADEGKVISVDSSGEYVLEDLTSEVPEPSVADEGKTIVVNSEGEYVLDNAPSGLPSYTDADIGKTLNVASIENPPVVSVVFPEQSVTTSTPIQLYGQTAYYGVVNNANVSLINTDDTYDLTVDNQEYEVSFANEGGALLALEFDAGVAILVEDNSCKMVAFTDNETHVIKLEKTTYSRTGKPVWGADSIAIINFIFNYDTNSYTCDKTYSELEELTAEGYEIYANIVTCYEPVRIKKYLDLGGYVYGANVIGSVTNASTSKTYLRCGNCKIEDDDTVSVTWTSHIELTAGDTP